MDPFAIDINLLEGGRRVHEDKYFSADGSDTLEQAVKDVVKSHARAKVLEDDSQDEDELVNAIISRITSITCVGKPKRDLLKYLSFNDFPLRGLHSASTPILSNGLNIELALPDKSPAKKTKRSAFSLLMTTDEGEPKYLPRPPDKPGALLDNQIVDRLHILCTEEIRLGFFHATQRECLTGNLRQLGGVLCFVEKYWKRLLKLPFPTIPTKYSASLLLEVVSMCTRLGKVASQTIKLQTLSKHLGTLAELTWNPYKKSVTFNPCLDKLKEEISVIYEILKETKDYMTSNSNPFTANEPAPGISSFEKLPDHIILDEETGEFFVPIRPAASGSKKRPGRKTNSEKSIARAITNLCVTLKHRGNYEPLHLTDEVMGICDEAYDNVGGVLSLSPQDRAWHRHKFREAITKGLNGMGVNLFGRKNEGGSYPASLCVWKVPLFKDGQSEGKVAKAIEDCRKEMPKKISKESWKCLNNIIKGLANPNADTMKALKNYLFMGEVNVKGREADEYLQFILDLAQGNEVDPSFMVDGRSFNSRGGKGIFVCHWNLAFT